MFVDPAPTIYEGANTGMLGGIDQYSDVRDSLSRLGIKVVKRGMQSDNFVLGTTGWKLDADGTIYGYSAVFAGGTIGGFSIGTDYVRDAANSFGLASTVTGGDDVRFWAGATYANRATAPFRVYESGIIYATGAVIDGTTTIGGRVASVLALAIDSAGHFVDANLSTAANQILGTFTFGVSGAIAIITDVNNGIWISPTGILGKKASATTFSLGIDGTANFAGTLSAVSGTFGTITAGTLNGLTIDGTSTLGGRVGSTIASAIDSLGHFIDANLNTSAKNILADFTFGVSGALQIGTYVNGVSGDIRISPAGIIGRNSAGVNTFTLDGTTGNATFAGTLAALGGTFGAITGGTFTVDTSGYIRGGQTTYDSGTGFFFGYSGGEYKFSLGNSAGYKLTWNGTVLTIAGTLSAAIGTLGALTIASGGNIKLGQTAYATGTGFWMGDVTGTTKFSIGSATNYFTFDGVNADATSFRYLEIYTAGENITAGNVVCIKPSTTITDIATQDSWADEANPADTHGSDVNFYVGVSSAKQNYGYVEFDETAFPNPQDILKAELILTTAGNQPAGGSLTVFTIDAAWDEATLCWNNKPAVTDQVNKWGDAGEIGDVPTAPNTQYVIEITQIVRRWKNADLTFYGFWLSSGLASPHCFHSSEATTASYRPFIRITNLAVSDGKVYKADFSDYKLCRFIAGIAIETKSAAESIKVQISGKNSNQSGLTIGKIAYLGNTGALATELNNVTNIVQIGQVISATTVHIDIGYSPLLIEHNTVALTELELIVPEDAKFVVINSATKANVICYRGVNSLGAAWSIDGSVPKVTLAGYNQYYFYR